MPNKKYHYYRQTITCDGRRYDVYAKTEKELGEKVYKKREEISRNEQIISNTITVNEWALRCISSYKTNQSYETQKKYINRVKHCILSQIGNMRVKDVRPIHCQDVVNEQFGYSKTQINEVFNALKFIFSHAYQDHLISYDPTISLTKPKASKPKKRRALTPEERKMVLQVGATDRRYYLYLLMLLCGCRPSEAANAMASDIYEKKVLAYYILEELKQKMRIGE